MKQIPDFLAGLVDGTGQIFSGDPVEPPDSVLQLQIFFLVRRVHRAEQTLVATDHGVFLRQVHDTLPLVVRQH